MSWRRLLRTDSSDSSNSNGNNTPDPLPRHPFAKRGAHSPRILSLSESSIYSLVAVPRFGAESQREAEREERLFQRQERLRKQAQKKQQLKSAINTAAEDTIITGANAKKGEVENSNAPSTLRRADSAPAAHEINSNEALISRPEIVGSGGYGKTHAAHVFLQRAQSATSGKGSSDSLRRSRTRALARSMGVPGVNAPSTSSSPSLTAESSESALNQHTGQNWLTQSNPAVETTSSGLLSSLPLPTTLAAGELESLLCDPSLDGAPLAWIFAGSRNDLRVFDADTCKLIFERSGAHNGIITALEYAQGTVWSASWDGTVKQWDTREHNNFVLIRTVHPAVGGRTAGAAASASESDDSSDLLPEQNRLHRQHSHRPVTVLRCVKARHSAPTMWAGTTHALFLWDMDGTQLAEVPLEDFASDPPVAIEFVRTAAVDMVWVAVGTAIFVFSADLVPLIEHDRKRPRHVLRSAPASGPGAGGLAFGSPPPVPPAHTLQTEKRSAARPVAAGGVPGLLLAQSTKSMPSQILSLVCVGDVVWAGDRQGGIDLWSAHTFENVAQLRGAHSSCVNTMKLIPVGDGWQVWTFGRQVCIWDAESALCLRRCDAQSEFQNRSGSQAVVIANSPMLGAVEPPAQRRANNSVRPTDLLDGDAIMCAIVLEGSDGHGCEVWTGSHAIAEWEVNPQAVLASPSIDPPRPAQLACVTSLEGDKYVGEVCTRTGADASVLGATAIAAIAEADGLARNRFASRASFAASLALAASNAISDELEREGRGELHCKNGEIYVGEWKANLKHGLGVTTYADKSKHTGMWERGERHGHGVQVFSDGTIFEGNWRRGLRFGPGVLKFANGDTVSGDWENDTDMKSAVFTKGNIAQVSRSTLELFHIISQPALDKLRTKPAEPTGGGKWRTFFSGPRLDAIVSAIPEDYREYVAMLGPVKDSALPLASAQRDEQRNAASAMLHILSVMLHDPRHPLGQSVDMFAYAFNASNHVSYGGSHTLLQHAIDDAHSFIGALDACVVKHYFPTRVSRVQRRAAKNLVANIAFAKVYATLFALFRETNKKRDDGLSRKFYSLSTATIHTAGVARKFWLLPSHTDGERDNSTDSDNNSNSRLASHSPYLAAIYTLRQLPEKRTIGKKLRTLIDVNSAIILAVDEFNRAASGTANFCPASRSSKRSGRSLNSDIGVYATESENEDAAGSETPSDDDTARDMPHMSLGADDKFPILIYCLIKANVPNLHTELSFIKEFAESDEVDSEAGYRLIELEQAIEFIESVDLDVFDEHGFLISIKTIEDRLYESIADARNAFLHTKGEMPRLVWLAEILLTCGTLRFDTVAPREIESPWRTASIGIVRSGGISGASSDKASRRPLAVVELDADKYAEFIHDEAYMDLAATIFQSIHLKLSVKNGRPRVEMIHSLPQHVYKSLSGQLDRAARDSTSRGRRR